ncbi:MAG: hypothetical protein ACFFER_09945 [Candidatus Thorarchaeota archaeon]
MTSDETPDNDDSEVRDRMRKRFQELDEQQMKRDEAGAAWVMVSYFGFLITFIGAFMMAVFLGIIPLSLEMLISVGVILFGVFFMAIGVLLRSNPKLVTREL